MTAMKHKDIRNCFNPHTHAGCDTTNLTQNNEIIVSIHTPTQGVTMKLPIN